MIAFTGCGSSKSVAVSGTSFDFGDVAMGTQVRRIAVTVTNSSKSDVQIAPTLSGSSDFSIASDVSCAKTVGGSGACSIVVVYAPSANGVASATLDLGLSSDNRSIDLTGNGKQLSPGQSIVAATDNPQVALYTYVPLASGNISVEFGQDTSYGLKTSPVAATAGTPVMIFVAGMLANTAYHMRAISDGGEADSDQTFTTTSFPSAILPNLNVTSTGTPQPGVEFMNPAYSDTAGYLQAYAVDLKGNLIWGYNYPDRSSDDTIQSFRLIPNGDIVALIGVNSAVKGPPASGSNILVREINLAGVPVRQITLAQINSQLSGVELLDLHHDVNVLPNGHWLMVANAMKSANGIAGQSGSTNVLGDVVVDLDQNFKVAWTWSEFDNLDINRAPAGYPDWTHTNAILYSPDDGNLLISSRHQSWVIKVDYRNGAGTGTILWRLGYQGDFKLTNGAEPQDWFFGQHQPSFVGSSTSGKFELTLMDNGYNRQLTPGTPCSGTSCYTTVPILSVDESAKTATVIWRDTFDPSMYSFWGGGTTALTNGNLEFDLCAEGKNSEVDEVTVTNPSNVVWSLKATGQNLYRANRMPSLYPGVQW